MAMQFVFSIVLSVNSDSLVDLNSSSKPNIQQLLLQNLLKLRGLLVHN